MSNCTVFSQMREGKYLVEFFEKLCKEIEGVKNNPYKPDDISDAVLLLNTRKGYWIYKIYEHSAGVQKPSYKVISDRYVKKIIYYSYLKDKLIYLVDDTLIKGYSLLETYMLLAQFVDEDHICPLVFALCDEVDIEAKISETAGTECNFWKKLKSYIRLSEDQIGEFCIRETELLHQEQIPFVIDLPFLKDKKKRNSELDFSVSLTAEQFRRLQNGNNYWKFHLNEFKHVASKRDNILQGFIIQMRDEQLLEKCKGFVYDFVVEGIYSSGESGNVNVVFVPFAIVNSMSLELTNNLWETLFDKKGKTAGSLNVGSKLFLNDIVRKHRECIYILSMMIAERFAPFFEELTGTQLGYNYTIMEEHYPRKFRDTVKHLEKEMKKNPDIIVERIIQSSFYKEDSVKDKIISQNLSPYDETAAYDIINGELQAKRDILWNKNNEIAVKGRDEIAMLEIGQIRKILDTKFSFASQDERRYSLTRIVVTMLCISTCSNKLVLSEDKKSLLRGFRYGENSDLLLPFFNLYFYWAVVLFRDKVSPEKAAERYDLFVSKLKEQFDELHLFGRKFTEDKFEQNRRYFKKAIRNDFQIYNKTFLLSPYLFGQEEQSTVFYMEKMEEFIKKINV